MARTSHTNRLGAGIGERIELQARLAAEVARLDARLDARMDARAEGHRESPRRVPAPPAGMRWLAPPKRALLDHPRLLRATFARYLFLRAWLAHRAPTPAGRAWLARRVRGGLLYGLALVRARAGAPLPTKHADTYLPPWVLVAPPRAAVTRAWGDGGDGGDGADYGGDYGDVPDDLDPVDWWATNGDAGASLTPAEVVALEAVVNPRLLLGNVADLTLQDVLAAYAQNGMSDLEILQMLDSAWNGQMALWASGDVLTGAGISAGFDLIDPNVYAYLQQQAGMLISGVDETSRRAIANLLWGYAGGFDGLAHTLSVDALARQLLAWGPALGIDLGENATWRAYLIAQTEMARAESFGGFIAMWQTGARQKIWIPYAGACQICVGNGEAGAIPIQDAFPSLDLAPPGHPICRCSLGAQVSDTFNPDDWTPRDPAPLLDLLTSDVGGLWPDASAITLPRAARHQPPWDRARAAQVRDALTAAAHTWARAAGLAVPETEETLRALARRIAAHPPHAADAAYWRAVTRAIREVR